MKLREKAFFDLESYGDICKKIRQIFPVLCGYLIPISFGMMLGWPSLAYPYLLSENNNPPVLIDMDLTSLIAGFLMEGNSIGVLFSTSNFLGSKTVVFLCCCLQCIGWFIMFGVSDIIGLLLSRVSIGFGNGCGVGHLKRYIKETCEPELADKLMHYIPIGLNIGVVLIYIVGAYVDFKTMSVFGMIFPLLAMFTFGVIPKRTTIAKRASAVRNMFANTSALDLAKVEDCLNKNKADECEEPQANVFKCLRDSRTRNGLLLIFLIVFMQQYTGGPANIVYSQMIFNIAGTPYAKICSIIYSIFFLIFTVISLKYVQNFPRKANLLIGSGACVIIIGLLALYYLLKHYLLQMSYYFCWSPLFLLILFNAFHTFSLGTVPIYIIIEKIPKRSRNVVNKFFVIHFSMSAVISTKIFQVLYSWIHMSAAYAFLASVALIGFFLLLILMDDYNVEEEKKKSSEKYVENDNQIQVITRL